MEGFIKKEIDGKKAELLIDSNFFDKEVVLKASYQFLDKAYFFFKKDSNGNFIAQITLKEDGLDLEKFIGDYYDELINFSLRVILEKDNKEIRDKIFDTAIGKSFDVNNFYSQENLPNNNGGQIDFDKDIDEILREIENDPDLKIDEEEINRILKEIEQESFDIEVEKESKISLDFNGLENVKKKFQNRD